MHLEVFNLTNLLGECVGGDALHVAAETRSVVNIPLNYMLSGRDNHRGTLG